MARNFSASKHKLRFHENPSFEKIFKNRCSGAWINGFSSFGAWNFTGCLYFTYGYGKRCMHHPKKQKKICFAQKTP